MPDDSTTQQTDNVYTEKLDAILAGLSEIKSLVSEKAPSQPAASMDVPDYDSPSYQLPRPTEEEFNARMTLPCPQSVYEIDKCVKGAAVGLYPQQDASGKFAWQQAEEMSTYEQVSAAHDKIARLLSGEDQDFNKASTAYPEKGTASWGVQQVGCCVGQSIQPFYDWRKDRNLMDSTRSAVNLLGYNVMMFFSRLFFLTPGAGPGLNVG